MLSARTQRICLMIFSATILLILPAMALAQGVKHMEAEDVPNDLDYTPDCTFWHELHPDFCAVYHQSLWEDSNGDEMLSPCDVMWLDEVPWHVEWVGPTYYVDHPNWILEPLGDHDPYNPVGEDWFEIRPGYGAIRTVDGWEDNGDGILGVGDMISFDGYFAPILDVRLNIQIAQEQEGCWLNCPAGDGGLITEAGAGEKSPDLNFNGQVDLVDFAFFGAAYLTTDYCADFNCSGMVDLVDFAFFGMHFLHGPGPNGVCN